MLRAVAALSLLAACPSPAPDSARPLGTSGTGSATGSAAGSAAAPSQEEQLAAIQKAMNELDEATQGCWAAAAVERFDIEGELKAHIDIGDVGGGGPMATVAFLTQDTVRNPRLASCVIAVLTNYPWAPPLYRQSIQLPFKFRAPTGQNLIDRALVPWNGQAKVSMAVLLDEHNSGNDAASMIEVAIASGGTTTLRSPDRAELWYFLGPARVSGMGAAKPVTVAAGDMMYMGKGGAREVQAMSDDVHAVLVMVPGGPEGAARAGALPTPPVGSVRSALVGPTVLLAAKAKTFGSSTIFLEPAVEKAAPLSASVLAIPAGANVAEHAHANETEMLYILEGSGMMTVKGVTQPVTATSVVQIPANTKHAFTATSAVRALQIYTPAGPEQRFKATTP